MRKRVNKEVKTSELLFLVVPAAAVLVFGEIARADNLAAAAAKASRLVNRPIAASPHALEEFPWLLRGPTPPTAARGEAAELNASTYPHNYPDNFAATAARASALVNRPIAATPHGVEEFPWLLREPTPVAEAMGGTAEQIESTENNKGYPDNLAAAAAKASALVNRPVFASPHALEEFPALLRANSQ